MFHSRGFIALATAATVRATLWTGPPDLSYDQPADSIAPYPAIFVLISPAKCRPPLQIWVRQFPLAPGTLEGCYAYRTYKPELSDYGNLCQFVARYHGIYRRDLLEWNPSLDCKTCMLQDDFNYCVEKTEESFCSEPLWHDMCLSPSDFGKDTTVDGTHPECDCYTRIDGRDIAIGEMSECEDLVEDIGLPIDNVRKYNSWIGSDCDGTLHEGLTKDATRAVCVGVGIVRKCPTRMHKPDMCLAASGSKSGKHNHPIAQVTPASYSP